MSYRKILSISILTGVFIETIIGFTLDNIGVWMGIGLMFGVAIGNFRLSGTKDPLLCCRVC